MQATLPRCEKCRGPFLYEADGAAYHRTLNPLLGDCFFRYTCSGCTQAEPVFERLPMSWINIIQLVLFHLHKTDKTGVGFFRWKEDICRLIEERWDQLCPTKSRTASWMNSVSSVLSANVTTFLSGFDRLKQPGWWALKNVQPPRPGAASHSAATDARAKRKRPEEDEEVVVDVGEEDYGPIQPARSPATVDTAHTLLYAKHLSDKLAGSPLNSIADRIASVSERIPNVSALLPQQQEATPTTVKAAQEIKRKLVERLLKVDSKLLQEALASAPVMPFVSSSSTPPPLASDMYSVSVIHAGQERDATTMATMAASAAAVPLSSASSASSFAIDGKPRVMMASTRDLKKLQKASKPANYVRASPHENELLETCLRISNPDATLLRLKRKLIVRRMKRRVGLPVFDIDAIMYLYLKSSDPLAPLDAWMRPASGPQQQHHDHYASNHSAKAEEEPKTFFDIPYHRDPSLSFLAKLNGVANTLPGYPPEFISPFTGLRLPGCLHREYQAKPARLRLLDELRARVATFDPDESESAPAAPIDYVYMRKEWLQQVNRLLRRFFWPGIDMVESLDAPDYGVLVMYRKMVIGCAFLTVDGYMTYFLVHPEWGNCGIGSTLLYLALTRVAPKHLDVTLHVSATNPALLLYQRFGFKPEEYIVNFYDKYFRESEENVGILQGYSKNAYLIRYRR